MKKGFGGRGRGGGVGRDWVEKATEESEYQLQSKGCGHASKEKIVRKHKKERERGGKNNNPGKKPRRSIGGGHLHS